MAMQQHLVLLLALLLLPCRVHAWLVGNGGHARWDYDCHLDGPGLHAASPEPGSRCAKLCLDDSACSHWSWTATDGGTCWLQSGAGGHVVPDARGSCGFLPARFALDETAAFDLGLQLQEDKSERGLSDVEAHTALRLLNSFRQKRGKPRLLLDARLVLAAHELAATCDAVEKDGFALLPQLPTSITPRGFNDQVYAVSVRTTVDETVEHAIEGWTSSTDTSTGLQPAFYEDVGVVGFAKRYASSDCRSSGSEEQDGSAAATAAVTWTLLLARAN